MISQAVALLIVTVSPAVGQDYGHHGGMEPMTCPVGGERFEALVSYVYSTFGARPDGKPTSYWFMPLPLPECPSNGLVLFEAFTPEQVDLLEPLIASDEYRAMLHRDSTYYRAQWLATRIGFSEQDALHMLLAATWQVKPSAAPIGQPLPSAERAEEYQREFVQRVLALPPAPDDEEYLTLYARAANAERELGRFATARTMLRQLDSWTRDPDLRAFSEALAAVVERQDSSAEPLDMIEEYQAATLCLEAGAPDTDFNRAYCARPDVRERIDEIR